MYRNTVCVEGVFNEFREASKVDWVVGEVQPPVHGVNVCPLDIEWDPCVHGALIGGRHIFQIIIAPSKESSECYKLGSF